MSSRLGALCLAGTMRYGHLVRGQFTEQERAPADVQLGDGKVLPLRPTVRASQ